MFLRASALLIAMAQRTLVDCLVVSTPPTYGDEYLT